MKSVLIVIGTRPEAIKLAPILVEINKNKFFINKVCVTKQHTDILDSFLLDLKINVDYQLKPLKKGSNLHQIAAHILSGLEEILIKAKPDLVLVQGDTTTAFAATLAAFYSHIPVAHIESGLRTNNLYAPWPEEAHRVLSDKLSTYLFTPTLEAKNNLITEGISPKKIWVVGNTSIDAIRLVHKGLKPSRYTKELSIVVTVHRRENQGRQLIEICKALYVIAKQFPEVKIRFLLHPNPAVRNVVIDKLSKIINIELIEPKNHISFVQLLDSCSFIMTDSGGLQEEAPFLGKPVLVLRDTTERVESLQAGTARLIGTEASNIIDSCKELLKKPDVIKTMSKKHYPYGDGYAAKRIVDILATKLK